MSREYRDEILKATKLRYESEILSSKVNIDIILSNAQGVAEHPDFIATVDVELDRIASAEDKLAVIKNHFTPPKIP